jgi:hypothetical protein
MRLPYTKKGDAYISIAIWNGIFISLKKKTKINIK